MKNKILIYKVSSLALIVFMLGAFTHCVSEQQSPVAQGGSSRGRDSGPAPSGPKDEGQQIFQANISIGVKSFEEINYTFSTLTGVSTRDADVITIYNQVLPSLPTDNDLKMYSATTQIGITKLASEYCHKLLDSSSLRANIWPSVNFGLSWNSVSPSMRELIIEQMLIAFWGDGVVSDAEMEDAYQELVYLMDDVTVGEPNNSTTTRNAVKAACTVALSSPYVTFI